MDKAGIKKEIDGICKNLMTDGTHQFVTLPVILVIYLGEESCRVIKESLRDAFAASFKMETDIYEITLDDPSMNSDTILELMKDRIRDAANDGKNYQDVRFLFVSFMDEPLINEGECRLVEGIGDAFKELNGYNISTKRTSFYGLFRQVKKADVKQEAFAFIRAGKDIWNNIYHMEMPFFDDNVDSYTQLIAVHSFGDDPAMHQKTGGNEYAWRSLDLSRLKLPEMMISRLIRGIYAGQLEGNGTYDIDWDRSIIAKLAELFDRLLMHPEYSYEQYIPLKYFEEEVGKSQKTFGFFGRPSFKDQNENAQQHLTQEAIIDESSLENLVKQNYSDIKLTEEKCEEFLEDIISCASSINQDHNQITKTIINILNREIKNQSLHLEGLKKRNSEKDNTTSDISELLKKLYQYKKDVAIPEKKIEIMEFIINYLAAGNTVNRIVSNIIRKNKEYTDTLDRLSIREYGGTLLTVSLDGMPSFHVNQPIREIAAKIGNDALCNVIRDENQILEQLEHFLRASTASGKKEHILGQINGPYNELEGIRRQLLMTPVQAADLKIKEIVAKFPEISIRPGDIYRDNTFYIISYRNYSSDGYIYQYRRK